MERLRALVQHAYENVPYYRRIFEQCRLTPEDIATVADLQKLPILTREDVRDNLEDLVARNIDRSRLRYVTTSGSTGRPLGLYHDEHTTDPHEDAFRLRQWSWAGYRFGDSFVTLRTTLTTEPHSGERVWWAYHPAENELLLSSMDMSEENLYRYAEKLKEFKPRFFNALPSSLVILARFIKRNGIGGIGARAIFCESETVHSGEREFIESQFGCRIFAGYGHSERAVDAVECEQHRGYHVSMEYGILELVDKSNEPVTQAGCLGRVVGTGFDTYCMPLIRYATDDLASHGPGTCSCHRQSPLIEDFWGRISEFVVSRTGQMVPYCVLEAAHSPTWTKIRELRFLQEREGELLIQIARAPSFSEQEIAAGLLDELHKRLDKDQFSIAISFVDHVPRKGGGKLRALEQRLPIKLEDLDGAGGKMAETTRGA